jgi:hypothetical protein
MRIKNFIFVSFLSVLIIPVRAEEGLWIPMLLQRYNIDIMQKEGLKLSAEDIYSINQACLKDAIVIFGGGCTGELISEDGLLLTNHHCGYSAIQTHSSVDNDYLTDGFWARSRDEELPNARLKVTFLIRIEDVTNKVLESINPGIPEEMRDSIVDAHITQIKKESVQNSGFKTIIKPFYYGNEYYMFIYQDYTDVRLVGAPPGAIGNYGEDFDNWVWPRHTGDFSLFRIYAGKNNEPADYSPENIPYKSKKHLTISASGIHEGDFTMVMGYPGNTTEYIISDEISFMLNTSLPKKVAVRNARLKILDKYMKQNDTTRIKYASKYRSISNAWKKWEGVIVGLKSTDALSKKKMVENRFQEWTGSNPEIFAEYGGTLTALRNLNSALTKFSLVYEYSGECVTATELIEFAIDFNSFFTSSLNLTREDKIKAVSDFKNSVLEFFKDYNQTIDEEIFASMLRFYYKDIDKEFYPDFFQVIQKKYKGDFEKFASETFKKSIFCSKKALMSLLDQFPDNSIKISLRIQKDPVIGVFKSFSGVYSSKVFPYYDKIKLSMQVFYRNYMRGLREMESDKILYPDANFTMRIAYGKVEGYKPADAVEYTYSTNLSGVIEKYHSDTVNYSLPKGLLKLYNNKDYGPWVDKNGEIPVCFVASNHTSGGNSGSPILNANGQLIGLNFDRNWEGTMSDIYYDVSICRNIAVDIRYVLFIIDKYAGAGYLINEMDIQRDSPD